MATIISYWGRERTIKSRTLQQGIQSIESTRGISSHQHNPFVTFKRKNMMKIKEKLLVQH